MDRMNDRELEIKSVHYRLDILRYIRMAGAGHTGGDLSCIDILNVLYNDVLHILPGMAGDPSRDRYVQSKGHSVEALYVVLADRGFFAREELESLCKYRSPYVGHPTRKVKGIEFNTGALGHGLSVSAGMALAAKKDNAAYRVFTLLGDGELAEGSNWEAAMLAAHYRLDNLTAILDHNTLQITGRTSEVCDPNPIADKFRAFGWEVARVDGHHLPALRHILNHLPLKPAKPSLIMADTIKGKGVSFMEDQKKWHHGVPSDDEYARAVAELQSRLNELTG